MKRITLAMLAALAGAALLSQIAVGQSVSSRRFEARMAGCHASVQAAQRWFKVVARQKGIRGTRTMAMRFDAYRRDAGSAHFVRFAGDGLSQWIRSDPYPAGASPSSYVYVYRKRVEDLAAPAAYKVRVGFRWYSPHGRVLATRFRTTAICWQPDLRPDLTIPIVEFEPANAYHSGRFRVAVANSGATAARDFLVSMENGEAGPAATTQTVPRLGSHRRVTLFFDSATCATPAPPRFTADPDGRVAERNEQNNARSASCP
jgi:hypothetical protein